MRFLFFAGFLGVLAGLAVGLLMNDYQLGILLALAGIGTILFTLPFLLLPLPLDLNLSMKVTNVCSSCGATDEPPPDKDKPDWGPVVGEDDDDDGQ